VEVELEVFTGLHHAAAFDSCSGFGFAEFANSTFLDTAIYNMEWRGLHFYKVVNVWIVGWFANA
jgi:hypothetical protein